MDDDIRDEYKPESFGDHLFYWKRKFDNFWYHYKIALIMGICILAFIIFVIVQCSGRIPGDANVAYIGSGEISAEHYNNLQRALNEILGEDLNGDGEIHVEFTYFNYMTQTQAENARAQGLPVNMQSLITVQTQIHLELAAGNIIIYFIDPNVYRELNNSGVFMPLEDSLGYLPENAHDAFTLRLGNLPAWQYYEGLNDFPSNTVVAVRNMHLEEENKKDMKERYERNLKMFKKLFDFKYLPDDLDEDDD